jgi:cytochrome P450
MDARVKAAKIDLSDNATFAQGFPHDCFTWAREHAPVHWHEPTPVTPDGEGFWVMSRHEDAMAIMLDPVTFSCDKGGGRSADGTGLNDERQAGKFLNWSDDPRHKRLRNLVNKDFTNRAIHELETAGYLPHAVIAIAAAAGAILVPLIFDRRYPPHAGLGITCRVADFLR